MAGKRRKKQEVAESNGDVASDPLAFIQADKLAVGRVRAALKALDTRKAPQAQHVRQFIRKVREAVAVHKETEGAISTEA